ncbi:MAG TPA: ABC-F family ATP-binding cassette domain-containing protein [Mycobacteriales bacterium]|nr:ABC-F family ATP-binding cassette domain-containing protein [Mycobacteriales bacterium]
MASLVARGVRVSYGAEPVLHGVDLNVGPGVRLGLLGPNGAGKSTLLRVLAGELTPEAGTVVCTGTVGLLPQEPDRRPGERLGDYLARRTGVAAADGVLQASASALDGGGEESASAYEHALHRWLDLGGADLEARAAEVCADLGLPAELMDTETIGLSGGQMARASLAAVLLSRYDVLLLDEPTNDLDLDGLERLESFVAGMRGGLVVVSHDREFLARCVTDVLELDPHNRVARLFAGGWDAYVEERDIARRHARESFEEFADKRAELQGRVQSTREMSVRGAVRAKRKAPDNDRAARGARMEAATSAASKVRSLETRLARLDADAVEEPRKEWQLRIALPAAPRSGDAVASLRSAVVTRGSFTLGPVDLDVRWADRVAVVGANGGGKTTLLQALLGRLPLTSGSASVGPGVVVGELDQVRRDFAGSDTVVDVVRRTAPDLLPEEVRTLLAKFGLRAAEVGRPAGSLSPGERTRAALAVLMARGTNCLVLDEPTNHLDLPAIEQLEEALAAYAGTLLLVTHDRRLLDVVPLTRRLEVVAGAVTETT